MEMTKEEAAAVVTEILKAIQVTNDNILDITNNLQIVLLNLQIENAHIKENTGIVPIAQELERNINLIHDSLSALIQADRDRLVNAISVLIHS